jgi:hypothetical protein
MLRIMIIPKGGKDAHLSTDHADETKAADTYGKRQAQHPDMAPMYKEMQQDELDHQDKLEQAGAKPKPKLDAQKASQPAAGYLGPECGPFECEHCVHWEEPNACSIVSGTIAPDGCCNQFEPGTNDMASDDDDQAPPEAAQEPEEGIES